MQSQSRKLFEKLTRVVKDQKGQGLVEYALILILIAIVVLAAVQGIGLSTNNTFSSVNNGLNSP